MNDSKNLYKVRILSMAALFAILISAYFVFLRLKDPWCHSCESILADKVTLSTAYSAAQHYRIQKPKIVILGSSRGEVIPSGIFGPDAMNLSSMGADVITKFGILDSDQNENLKEVIWLADYFEVAADIASSPVISIPYFQNWMRENKLVVAQSPWKEFQNTFDHRNFEGAMRLKNFSWEEPGKSFKVSDCESGHFDQVSLPRLQAEISSIYDAYTHGILNKPINPELLRVFKMKIKSYSAREVNFKILVMPYQPKLMQRLQQEHPEIYQAHLNWISELKSLEDSHVKVLDIWRSGIPGDDETPLFWNDGSHFTCHGFLATKPVIN